MELQESQLHPSCHADEEFAPISGLHHVIARHL